MSRTVEEILTLAYDRAAAMSEYVEALRTIDRGYEGDLDVDLPDLRRKERVAVANMMVQGVDQHGMRIASTMPMPEFPPLRPSIAASVDRATRRRYAVLGLWDENAIDIQLHRRARWLIAYAAAPVQIRPRRLRPGDASWSPENTWTVEWRLRTPHDSFPAPCSNPDDMTPSDCVFRYSQSRGWLRHNYPEPAGVVDRTAPTRPLRAGELTRDDDTVEIVEYVDGVETVLIATGVADGQSLNLPKEADYGLSKITHLAGSWGTGTRAWGVELTRYPNRTGLCPVVFPSRITLSKPQGQFDQMVGMFEEQAHLMALELNAVRRSVFPDTWAEQNPNETLEIKPADGLTGKIGIVKGGRIRTETIQPGFQVYPTIDRLAESMRVQALIPPDFGGQCTDEETEILTQQGWKHYDAVGVGDLVLTLDHDTGMAEWAPIEAMNVFPAQPRTMLRAEGRGHSSLTTLNHRWPVESTWNQDRKWVTSEHLTSGYRVPIAAMNSDLPAEPKYSDALVELVAWFWTEGTSRGSEGAIAQSSRNSGNVDRIRSALRSVFGAPTDAPWRTVSGGGQGGVGHDEIPRWREIRRGQWMTHFVLSAHAVRILLEHAPRKVPSYEFLLSLTQAQLELFIRTSLAADNCGPDRLGQADPDRSDAFAFAAILAGNAVSYTTRTRTTATFSPGSTAHIIRVRRRRWVNVKENALAGKAAFEHVTHDGIVWCPTTRNGTWYARRRGTTYFTGNSGSNIRTARRGSEIISSTVDFSIQEAQLLFQRSMKHEIVRAVETAKAYFGRRPKTYTVSWPGAKGTVSYTPNEVFEEAATFTVEYAVVGSDVNMLNVNIAQATGAELMSKTTGRRLHPQIQDPDFEERQIQVEGLRAAIISGLQQQMAAGAFPVPDGAAIIKSLMVGVTIEDAIEQVHKVMQERQATAGEPGTPAGPVEPGSPESQPGMAVPGAGAEAGIATIPAPAQGLTNLVQQLRQSRTISSAAVA